MPSMVWNSNRQILIRDGNNRQYIHMWVTHWFKHSQFVIWLKLEFKREDKFTPKWGSILTLWDNTTVLPVCAHTLCLSDKWTRITQFPTVIVSFDSSISCLNLAIKSKPRMQWSVMSAFYAYHLNYWSLKPITNSLLKVAVTGAQVLIPFKS